MENDKNRRLCVNYLSENHIMGLISDEEYNTDIVW